MNVADILRPLGRNVTDSCLYVVWDPLNEVGQVLVLDIQHLFVHFLHGHATSEDCSNNQVAAMTWAAGSHHVLGILSEIQIICKDYG